MIPRYSESKMGATWSLVAKFRAWLDVELAVLETRESLGQIPEGTTQRVREWAFVDEDVARVIVRRDRAIHHDLNAFVETMRLLIIACSKVVERSCATSNRFAQDNDPNFHELVYRSAGFNIRVADGSEEAFNRAFDSALARQCPEAGYFHDGMTSFDTEEPAAALIFRRANKIIHERLVHLMGVLWERAKRHRGAIMVGRTHVQHAQPVTFGVKCLNWLDMVARATRHFLDTRKEVEVMKLSGAVGMHYPLSPEVEDGVGKLLKLEPVIATQIVPLDRRAQLVWALARIAAVAGKIANDLWLMSQTEVGEVREPFGKRQKGSSAMPHKKNPITLEKLKGLPRLFPGFVTAMLSNIPTAHERDISQSSVERIVLPDAFGLLDHMLKHLARIIEGMSVFEDKMRENLELTQGTVASQSVEQLLKEHGMPAEQAYRIVQKLCFQAVEAKVPLIECLVANHEVRAVFPGKDFQELRDVFDLTTWVKHEGDIYARYGRLFMPEEELSAE